MKIRAISALLALALLFLLLPAPTETAAAAVTAPQIEQQIRTAYRHSLGASGRENFNGYCGTLVSWQLYYLGIESRATARDGKDHFDQYRGKTTTSGGYQVRSYPATQYTLRTALDTITKGGTENVYNLMVGFQKTNTAAGSVYGHALVVHAILDGVVYFVECFNASIAGRYWAEGQAIYCTIEEFCQYYDRWTVFEGVAYFGVKNYADLCREYPCHMEAMVLQDTPVYWEPVDPGVNEPQADRSMVSGQWIQITGLYQTPQGNYWYAVDCDGQTGYVPADKLKPEKAVAGDVAVTKLRVPTYIHKGNGFAVQGTVSAGIAQLDSVTVMVGAEETLYSATAQASKGRVLLNNSKINNNLPFRKMPVGTYTLAISAAVINHVVENGQVVAKEERISLYQSQFRVVSDWNRYSTVKFDGNGGVALMDQLVVARDEEVGTLPGAKRSGYAFAGWAKDPEGQEPVEESTVFSRDDTLYAQWTEGHTGEGGWHHTENGSHYCDGQTAAEGWFEFEGLQFYQYADGTLATGWAWIDGGLRYFNAAGALVTQLQGADGRVYCQTQGEGLLGWSIQAAQESADRAE